MINITQYLHTSIKLGRQLPQAIWQRAHSFGHSLVTWEGRTINSFKDSDFLSKNVTWEENLDRYTNAAHTFSKTALMTKEFYCWQPKESFISQGYKSYAQQKAAMNQEALLRWLQAGIITGISFAFFKAMQANFNCLGEMDEILCQMHYNETLSRPGLLAKTAVATGAWVLAGLLINSFSDFGMRGTFQEYQLTSDLLSIYKSMGLQARIAFWDAVKNKDQAKAEKLQQQAKFIKNSKEFYQTLTQNHLGLKTEDASKIDLHLNLFIEDISTQDLKALFHSPTLSETSAEDPKNGRGAQNPLIEA